MIKKTAKTKKITLEDLAMMTQKGFAGMDERLGNMRVEMGKRFDKVEDRLDKVEDRLGRVEDRLDKVEDRLGRVEDRLANVEYLISSDINKRMEVVEHKVRRMETAKR